MAVRPLPTDTPTHEASPTAPRSIPTLIAMLAARTPSPVPAFVAVPGIEMPTPDPTLSAAVGAATCDIPRIGATYSLVPASDAPEAARSDWAAQPAPALRAAVVEHNADARFYQLKAMEPPADFAYRLTYDGGELPIETGRTYRFMVHQDLPGSPPAGSALRIDEDRDDGAGPPLFLGVSTRETDGADRRLLGGDRAGFVVRQLPTLCAQTALHPCGFELRAGPVEVARGTAKMVLSAGEAGTLDTDPPYQVRVFASHYRRWLGDVPCADRTDWVLAYRVERTAGR